MLSEHRTKAGLTSSEGRGGVFVVFLALRRGVGCWGGTGWVRDDDFLTRSPRRDLSLNPPSVV